MDYLTLTIILSLFNPSINITSQKFSSTPFHLLFIILYSSPPCGSTPVLLGYLLLRHSCTWDKTLIFWSCQLDNFFLSNLYRNFGRVSLIPEGLKLSTIILHTSYTHFSITSQSRWGSNEQFIHGYKYIISSTHFLSHLNMHNLTSKRNMQTLGFQTQNSTILYFNI